MLQPVVDATPPLGNFQDLPSLGSRSTAMTEELPRSILENKLNSDQTGRNSFSVDFVYVLPRTNFVGSAIENFSTSDKISQVTRNCLHL